MVHKRKIMGAHLSTDLSLEREGAICTLKICRPPDNFIDERVVADLATALEALDKDKDCRVIILASEGKHFSAGADLKKRLAGKNEAKQHIYEEAGRLIRTSKPILAVVQGAAIGAGLGLALLADFRIGCMEARFSANFNRQAYHPGMGLTFTLPRLVGQQHAAWLFYSGKRLKGDEALAIGLIDRLVPSAELMNAARDMADEIATSGPLAVQSTRCTLREGFENGFSQAIRREIIAQDILRKTEDFQEGVRAMSERRQPVFKGM
ncbi:enoyl-CoA hydratase/isomerase family protein [Paralcaligenes sp. KSB-10]|uniref:enoyl-CoA hydratase/isomerase family protein n=1 Tax=Paralcaligenes sp. KSB-10 TaxID=2901142 RepID=UPI001E31952A|nr:enoyl-CoA hydratase/isomerase family protein [Paralcaligenes sp. KSB-10]UHL62954.1 enoyl-CoA hydratase/isomerase family protein [Paralcaligenes sp. KSB-10]